MMKSTIEICFMTYSYNVCVVQGLRAQVVYKAHNEIE